MKIDPNTPFFTEAQKDTIRKDLAEKGLGELQCEQFLMTCERTLLDPFSKQVYARAQSVNKARGNQPDRWVAELVIITGIDGLRAVAERSGEYEGQSPCEWFCPDPVKGDSSWQPFWTGKDPQFPEAARLAVHRKGFKEPMVGVARYHSYVQMTKGRRADGNRPATQAEPTPFWRKMPDVMLAKCAEALALRKAFPMLLSGLFLEEEILKDSEIDMSDVDPEPISDFASAPKEMLAKVAEAAALQKVEAKPAEADPQPAKKAMPKKATEPQPMAEESSQETPIKLEPAAEPAAAKIDAQGWENYVITHITMTEYAGRKVGELAPEEIRKLKVNWADKYATKITLNPGKVEESNHIKAAFAHHFPGE